MINPPTKLMAIWEDLAADGKVIGSNSDRNMSAAL